MKKIAKNILYGWAVFCTALVTGFILSVILTGGYIKIGFIDWRTIGLIRWVLDTFKILF